MNWTRTANDEWRATDERTGAEYVVLRARPGPGWTARRDSRALRDRQGRVRTFFGPREAREACEEDAGWR